MNCYIRFEIHKVIWPNDEWEGYISGLLQGSNRKHSPAIEHTVLLGRDDGCKLHVYVTHENRRNLQCVTKEFGKLIIEDLTPRWVTEFLCHGFKSYSDTFGDALSELFSDMNGASLSESDPRSIDLEEDTLFEDDIAECDLDAIFRLD